MTWQNNEIKYTHKCAHLLFRLGWFTCCYIVWVSDFYSSGVNGFSIILKKKKKSTFLDIIGSRQWMNMIKIILSGGYVFLLLQCVEMSSTWVRKKNSTNWHRKCFCRGTTLVVCCLSNKLSRDGCWLDVGSELASVRCGSRLKSVGCPAGGF